MLRILFITVFFLSSFVGESQLWVHDFNGKQAAFAEQIFTVTDAVNGGASQAIYKVEKRNNNEKDGCATLAYSLEKGSFRWDPYVALTVGIDNANLPIGKVPVGIAYDFKGAKHTFVFQDSDVMDYAYFQKTIKSASEWQSVLIPFAELVQPSWGKKSSFHYNRLIALAFQVMGASGEKGKVELDNIRFVYELPKKKDSYLPLTDTLSFAVQVPSMKSVPEIEVANWKNFNTSALALTFDDGLISQYRYVAPILKKYQFLATYYLITDVLQDDTTVASSSKFGYWDHFVGLYREGNELGAHTCTHPFLSKLPQNGTKNTGSMQYEIQESLRLIRKKINQSNAVVSFAYPFVDYSPQIKKECERFFIASRALGTGQNPFVGGDHQEVQAFTINYEGHRTLAKDSVKVRELIEKIDQKVIREKFWSVLLFHDVFPFDILYTTSDSWHPVSSESFDYLCAELKARAIKNNLWIAPVKEIMQYKMIRETLQITLVSQRAQERIYGITHSYKGKSISQNITFQWTSDTPVSALELSNVKLVKKVDEKTFILEISSDVNQFTIKPTF